VGKIHYQIIGTGISFHGKRGDKTRFWFSSSVPCGMGAMFPAMLDHLCFLSSPLGGWQMLGFPVLEKFAEEEGCANRLPSQ
jgi:hypothetical protein